MLIDSALNIKLINAGKVTSGAIIVYNSGEADNETLELQSDFSIPDLPPVL
jgi:hypothetical protein